MDGYFEYVYCPYCNEEVNCMGLDFDEDTIEHTCSNCGKDYEIVREWTPSFSSYEKEYAKCGCGRELKASNMEFKDGKYKCNMCRLEELLEKYRSV